mmetsp:Transcript_28920/g.77917  ORF Transcript_28920/g.77917 Transcript_28920/m.77917 type:complete len:204 (-) Transcript_28920:698-1309(-)
MAYRLKRAAQILRNLHSSLDQIFMPALECFQLLFGGAQASLGLCQLSSGCRQLPLQVIDSGILPPQIKLQHAIPLLQAPGLRLGRLSHALLSITGRAQLQQLLCGLVLGLIGFRDVASQLVLQLCHACHTLGLMICEGIVGQLHLLVACLPLAELHLRLLHGCLRLQMTAAQLNLKRGHLGLSVCCPDLSIIEPLVEHRVVLI